VKIFRGNSVFRSSASC